MVLLQPVEPPDVANTSPVIGLCARPIGPTRPVVAKVSIHWPLVVNHSIEWLSKLDTSTSARAGEEIRRIDNKAITKMKPLVRCRRPPFVTATGLLLFPLMMKSSQICCEAVAARECCQPPPLSRLSLPTVDDVKIDSTGRFVL